MQAHNLQIARRNLNLCRFCGICRDAVSCPTEPGSVDCTGCGACYLACPYEAIEIVPRERAHERKMLIKVIIDGEIFFVPDRITVSDALAFAGYQVSDPCGVGGCFACAVTIDGETKPACVTAVAEGMGIDTVTKPEPLRVVSGFAPHVVGGVGTPYRLKNYTRPVEVACFLHGCNYRCPQCQNHVMAFTGGVPMTPENVAGILIGIAEAYHVGRVAFSGGESTLNREFLIKAIKLLKTRDSDLRIHVDTNGSLLTPDYIDELVDAGMTDLGIDLKVDKLTHGDLGQMQMYVNYYDLEVMSADDNPTVGLILCAEKNDAVVRYVLGEENQQIFASRYRLQLPSEEDLRLELQRERRLIQERTSRAEADA